MTAEQLIAQWLALPVTEFRRAPSVGCDAIACDCAGFINLLCQALDITLPWCLSQPRAMHYFGLLQEIGSNRMDQLQPGNLLAWRKDQVPKKGDSGHVLWVAGPPRALAADRFQLPVVDASKKAGGLSRRLIELHSTDGVITGVRWHLDESKIKRTAIYHHPLEGGRYCFGCSLPHRACNCGAIEPLLSVPNVVVLRHPSERKRRLATVSLIKQRYPGVLVKDGEVFSARAFSQPVLLYPDTGEEATTAHAGKNGPLPTILLIDGTWRKAKKILHLNPWLKTLPRLSLNPQRGSDYLLRKVADQQSLSSVEAYARVVNDDALGAALEPFMQRHIELMGRATYNKNYTSHINFVSDSD